MAEDSVDYGPLAGLKGTWKGDKGMDIAPDPDGTEENPYYETITFEEVGTAKNAEKQLLAAVRYLQVVRRKADDEVFHDQTGYWMYDKEHNTTMQSIVIPRGVALLAGGSAIEEIDGTVELHVVSYGEDSEWSVVQSPFMHENAKTLSFTHTLDIKGDTMKYSETTMVDIYGKVFEHTDTNILQRES